MAGLLDEDGRVDRTAVRHLVEDHWRLLMLSARDINRQFPTDDAAASAALATLGEDLTVRFDQQCQATAGLMSPEQAKQFFEMIDEESKICFTERETNKPAFYRRLGIDDTYGAGGNAVPQSQYRRQDLGELAVRTAVRATVWEAIWSLFSSR